MASLGEVFTAMEDAKAGGAYELRLSERTQIIARQSLQVEDNPPFIVDQTAFPPAFWHN
jgi:hypothetical protein